MFCTKCGKENEERNKFCFSCGASLKVKNDLSNKQTNLEPQTRKRELTNKRNNFQSWVIISVLIVFSIIILNFYSKTAVNKAIPDNSVSLTSSDKHKLCKSYISSLFNRPVSSMNSTYVNKKGGFHTEVSYVREFDRSSWYYLCRISDERIIWASMPINEPVGRWRFEDERQILNGQIIF